MQVREDLQQIVLHQNVAAITALNVTDANNQQVRLQFPDPFTVDSYLEIMHINFAAPISSGYYTITINYNGRINTNPLDRGFYRGYYYLNNQLR